MCVNREGPGLPELTFHYKYDNVSFVIILHFMTNSNMQENAVH